MRLRTLLRITLAIVVALGALGVGAAFAQDTRPAIDVIEVPGVLDPPLVNYLSESIDEANKDDAYLIVVALDSAGALDVPLARLLERIKSSKAPVVVWVGPRRAQAASGAALVVASSAIPAMAPGATLGPVHPADLTISPGGEAGRKLRDDEQKIIATLPGAEAVPAYLDKKLDAENAKAAGAVRFLAPTLAELLKNLDGQSLTTAAGETTIRLRSDETTVRLHKPGPIRRGLHVLTSAALVYLLILFGAGLIVFELFQPGFGVAGVTGGLLLVAAIYGMLVLPIAWWAAALVFLGLALLTVDVARDSLAIPTIAGTIALLAGSLRMFPVSALRAPLWLILLGTAFSLVFFVPVMTVVRRQQRPIGRDVSRALVGQQGEVRSMLNPEGFVWVSGELWRARSEDGSRMRVGESIEVTSLNGEVLMVRRTA